MYLLIAHKPSSSDYCRGCLMASYRSGFNIENHLDWEQLKEQYAKYVLANQNLDCNEAGWELYVFKDGHKIIGEGQAWCDFYVDYDAENWEEQEATEKALNAEGARLLEEVVEPLERQKKEKDEAARRKAVEEQKRREEAELARRKTQYETLKAEFEQEKHG